MYHYDDSKCFNQQTKQSENIKDYKIILRKIIKDTLEKTNSDTPFYKVLYPYSKSKWVDPYIEVAKEIRENFTDLVIISMGGASLNPQAMLHLIGTRNSSTKVHFLNNTDPVFFNDLKNCLNLNKTAFLVVSNSGETLETIILLKAVLNEYNKAGIESYKTNFYFITNDNDNKLYRIATELKATIFTHEIQISGRYAGFTNVCTLVGLVVGLNMEEYLNGANEVINNFWQDIENSLPVKSALKAIAFNKPILVNLGYFQQSGSFLEWYSQIIAESLGKNCKGFTPVRGLCPNDHHSVMQLYLDGPPDKLITLFHVKEIGDKILNDEPFTPLQHLNNLCFDAALNAFEIKKIPVKTLILGDLSEKSVGALMAHCMIEVIILGLMLEVNPFDQPGVELIKNYLKTSIKGA